MITSYEIYNMTTRVVEDTGLDIEEATAICERLNQSDFRTVGGKRYRFAVQPAGFLTDRSFRPTCAERRNAFKGMRA